MKGVAITGMGIISSIGNSVDENLVSLLNSKTAITTIENISTVHVDVIKVGEIKKTNQELANELQLSEDNNFSRTGMIGVFAAKEAVKNAGITSINEYKTGLISATSVGGMDMTERYYYDYFKNPEVVKYISSHNAGDISDKIANELGLKGMVTTISTACSSAANSIIYYNCCIHLSNIFSYYIFLYLPSFKELRKRCPISLKDRRQCFTICIKSPAV